MFCLEYLYLSVSYHSLFLLLLPKIFLILKKVIEERVAINGLADFNLFCVIEMLNNLDNESALTISIFCLNYSRFSYWIVDLISFISISSLLDIVEIRTNARRRVL